MKHRVQDLQGELLIQALKLCCKDGLELENRQVVLKGDDLIVVDATGIGQPFRPDEDDGHSLWLLAGHLVMMGPLGDLEQLEPLKKGQAIQGWIARAENGSAGWAPEARLAVVRAFLASRLGEEVDL